MKDLTLLCAGAASRMLGEPPEAVLNTAATAAISAGMGSVVLEPVAAALSQSRSVLFLGTTTGLLDSVLEGANNENPIIPAPRNE